MAAGARMADDHGRGSQRELRPLRRPRAPLLPAPHLRLRSLGAALGLQARLVEEADREPDGHEHHQAAGVLDALDAEREERRQPERSEEHTSELQSRLHLVCRLLLEKKKKYNINST